MKQIRTILLIIAAFILPRIGAGAAGQDLAAIKGTVVEKASGAPVGWATVALMRADSTLVAGAACNENGAYELSAPAGKYTLKASMLGYADYFSEIVMEKGVNELAPIALEQDSQMLSAASVTGRVSLVEMKIDKVVMNISQSAFAQGSNALELIRKAPGVTIDKDGNVKLNGKAVSVWIDGRPSYMDGKALEALLRSTNSESIDKFELMEHPSSKYDASGQGGIINIKTKRNMLAGLNGSAGLGGGAMHFSDIDDTPWEQSAWLNLSYRTKKTNTFVNLSETTQNIDMLIDNNLSFKTDTDNEFSRRGVSVLRNSGSHYNVKVGSDWFINPSNTLGFILTAPGGDSGMHTLQSATDVTLDGVDAEHTDSEIKNITYTRQLSTNVNYTHIFDEKKAAELTANLDYYRNSSKDDNNQNDTTEFAAAPGVRTPSFKYIDSEQIYNIYSAKADYQSVVMGMFMLEAGAKWALSQTDNNSLEQQFGLPDNKVDFLYREHVGAVYASLAGQLGPKFSFKAGLRGEYTNSFGDWRSSATKTDRSYFDLFPTVYLGYMPTRDWRFSASYSRRINRPGYAQLNPTKTYLDAHTYIMGNPEALPMYSDNVTLSVGYGYHLSLSAGYNHTNNLFSQTPVYEPDGTQILVNDNFGTSNMGYLALSVAALPVTKYLQFTASLNGLYMSSDNGNGFVNSTFAGQTYTSLSLLLPKDWKVDMDGVYVSSVAQAQFRTKPMGYANIAVKKNFLDNRLILTARCNDIFRSMNSDLEILDATGSGVKSFINQKQYMQKVIFDITWTFGKAQQTRQRKVGDLEEMSRVGGNNKIGQ